FCWLDALPVTPSGKIDRGSLPPPVLETAGDSEAGEGSLTPPTPFEEQLAGIWAEVLGLDRVGPDDDFFALGGHSLSAVRVASRARHALGVPLSVEAVLRAPSVAAQARVAESLVRTDRLPEPPL